MRIRIYQLDVEVNEDDEVIISQERRAGGPESGIVIPFDQIESLCGLLTKAGEQIENRREARNSAEEDRLAPEQSSRRR